MSSLSDLIKASRPLNDNDKVVSFSRKLYTIINKNIHPEHRGVALAAAFDLAVTAIYAERLSSNGWLYCRDANVNESDPKLYYPFVNACPRCALRNIFYFAPSKKPSSAQIGQASSTILTAFLDEHVKQVSNGECSIRALGGTGDVDAIAIEGDNVCLFEIKSAPLITFPVEGFTERMSVVNDSGEEVSPEHYEVTLPAGYVNELSLIVSETFKIPLGKRSGENWPFDSILDFIANENNLHAFVGEWHKTYQRYEGGLPKEKTFWLSNGCGQPPLSKGWPARRNGSGYESISDGKSSVGLDRTDDIKKGIYQVLKIGTHYKEFVEKNDYQVFTALASNIHAVKHHKKYLEEFEDMMWTIDSGAKTYITERNEETTKIKTAGLYNLYDGLITFTKGHFRDDWVKERFSF
jgi:hypothetical protein